MAILTTTQNGLDFIGGTAFIQTGGTTLMAIETGGFIGIGVNDPEAKLHVKVGTSGGGPYDSSVAFHGEGASRVIAQLSSTDDAYFMFGDAAVNNQAWLGYIHSNNELALHTGGSITLDGSIQFTNSQYASVGTLVTDASGNITVSSGGGAGGPYLPLTGGTLTGNLTVQGKVKAKGFFSHIGTYTANTYVDDWQKVYSHNWSTFSFSAFTIKVLAGGNTSNNNLNADVHISYKMQNGQYRVYANIVNYGAEALLAENFKINLSITSAASGSWTIWHKLITTYQTPFYTLIGSGIDGTWYSETPVASPTGDDDTWTERIILNSMSVDVDNSANVGIGTTAPTSLLEISKQLSAASTIDYPYTISSRDDGNSINQAGGEGVGIKFRIAGNANTFPGDSIVGASIAAIRESASDTDSSTGLGFFVTQNDETLDEALRIDHDKNANFLSDVDVTGSLDVIGGTIDVGTQTWKSYTNTPGLINVEVSGGNAINIYNTQESAAYLNFVDSQSDGSQYANLSFNSNGTNAFIINNMGYLTTISNVGAWTFTQAVSGITPTADANFATKAYVDDRDGTVKSVNVVTDGDALNVTSNTITGSGTMTLPWQGGSDQYVNGLGNAIDFPTIPQGTVKISGTPVAKQIAEWTSGDTIKGSATMQVNTNSNGINIFGNDASGAATPLSMFRNDSIGDDSFQFIFGSSTQNFLYSDSNSDNAQFQLGVKNQAGVVEILLSLKRSAGVELPLVSEIGSDTDKFLMLDSNNSNLVKYVTGANLLSYIGGTSSSGVTSIATTAPILGGTITGTGTLSLKTPVSGNWFNGGAAVVGSDGLMEVGRYIDFHNTDTTTSDFDVRLDCRTGNVLRLTGTFNTTSDVIVNARLGVGTDNPLHAIEVYGDASNISITNTTETDAGLIFRDAQAIATQAAAIKFNSSDQKLKFFVNDEVAQRMVIDTNGYVGINNTSPNVPLDVEVSDTGSSFNDGAAQFSNITTATSGGATVINVRNNYGGGNGTLLKFFRTSTSSSIGFISFNSAGDAVVYSTTSDYRLKEDLKSFNGLEIIDQIKTYNYQWKKSKSRGYGTLAHELQEVFPDAVTGEKDAEEMQGVDYSTLVPVLIKSIQELKKELEELKKEINK